MAITNRKHIRKILNDLEHINRGDVFKYTRGHLSVAQNKFHGAVTFSGLTPSEAVTNKTLQDLKSPRNAPATVTSQGVVRLSSLFPTAEKDTADMRDQSFQKSGFLSTNATMVTKDFVGVTKAEQFLRLTEKSQNALKEKKEKAKQQMLCIEQKLIEELQQCQKMEGAEKSVRLYCYECGKDAFASLIQHSTVFRAMLGEIKKDYDACVIDLLKNDDHRVEFIRKELAILANSNDLNRLRSLEKSIAEREKNITEIGQENTEIAEQIKIKRSQLDSILPPVLDPSASKCRPPFKISQAEKIHFLRKEIAAKEDSIRDLFSKLRAQNIPKAQYKTYMGTARDLQAEVNSLSAGCKMLERKVQSFESEMQLLVSQVEMSERDARILEEVLAGSSSSIQDVFATMEHDPFELIGKIESGHISLLDLDRLESQIDGEPWRSYIS